MRIHFFLPKIGSECTRLCHFYLSSNCTSTVYTSLWLVGMTADPQHPPHVHCLRQFGLRRLALCLFPTVRGSCPRCPSKSQKYFPSFIVFPLSHSLWLDHLISPSTVGSTEYGTSSLGKPHTILELLFLSLHISFFFLPTLGSRRNTPAGQLPQSVRHKQLCFLKSTV